MAAETQHFIKGTLVRPDNADDIGFKFDWTKDINEAELTTDSVILSNDAKRIVLEHIETNGIYEGIPYEAQVGSTTLEYYIDLTDSPKISGEGDGSIEVKIKRRKAVDYFKQQADGLTFDLVNKTMSIITKKVTYLIIRDNQAELLIMLALAFYNLQKALAEGIRDLAEAAAEIVRATTISGVAAAIILFAARAIYVAAILIALIKVTKDILEIIFPSLKSFKVSTVRELLEKGCQKLGYTFSSTIKEWDNMAILSKPTLCPKEGIFKTLFSFDNGLRTKGYPTGIGGDSVNTLGSLMDFCKAFCNGRLRVIGDTVHLERRDHWVIDSGITINNTLNLQDKRTNQWTYNTGESWKRYYLNYAVDTMDVHTYDNLAGIYSEHSTEPVNIANDDLVLIKGLVAHNFPLALGSRKEGLNFVEKAFLPYAQLADVVVNFLGGRSNLAGNILGREGTLQISQQYFGVTKLLYLVGDRQPANYRDIIGAEAVYQKFHKINQVKENFKRIFNATIAFSEENFQTLLDSNYVNDSETGEPLEILTFSWINESRTAEIEYAVLSKEAFNTETILIEGGGIAGTTTTSLTC